MQPTVCALMLTADRQSLTDRAVRSFLAQDYERKSLLIYDTGKVPYELPECTELNQIAQGVRRVQARSWSRDITLVREGLTGPIGRLRNLAIALTSRADIICHFDSDDWSAPSRISDQVKLLVESGKQAVGYREMLFWKRSLRPCPVCAGILTGCAHCTTIYPKLFDRGEAWLYSNTDPRYIISTSLCYWRKTWEGLPFAETMTREWRPWLQPGGLDTLGVEGGLTYPVRTGGAVVVPLMIAELHGGNTCAHESLDPRGVNRDGSLAWRRVPEWDARVRQILESA